MGFIKKSVVLAFGALAVQSAALAGDWKCNTASFSKTPSWNGSIYTVPLRSTCTVTHPSKEGFKSLHEFFLARLTKLGTLKTQGKSETLHSLPGKVWLVEDRFQQNGDDMIVQNETHIASDDKTRLISSTYSQSVEGTGNSKYVTYLDSVVDVTSKDGKTFKVVFDGTIQLDKPWLVPTSWFASGAEEGATSAFVKTRDELIDQIAGEL